MPSLYLASKSPRRLQILQSMGISDITVLPVGDTRLTAYVGDEVQHAGEAACDYVVRTAREKALATLERVRVEGLPAAPVLAADTVVILDGEILGKPADCTEATHFMQRLSGQEHEVRTAVVAGTSTENLLVAVSISTVHFTTMTSEQIAAYTATEEPYDKAGGYGIQGRAGLYIDRICGSYSGIMGLPVFETARLLENFGFDFKSL